MYFQFQTIERLKGWKEADLKSASSSWFHSNVFMFWKIDFMIENILKKYPKILDFRFLILYLCSVISWQLIHRRQQETINRKRGTPRPYNKHKRIF